jgi:ribosomal protein L37AE/L43A
MAATMGLGGLPSFTGLGMDPAGTANPASQYAEPSGENPMPVTPEQGNFSLGGVSEEDQKLLIDTIAEYRASWAQDRLERIRQWTENIFYWKGIQVIRWDTSTNCWYDALAWARSNNQDSGEDTDIERWINPLTLMFCNVFTGTMSRAVPKTIVKPQDADPGLKDTVTAKAAAEAIGIIERKNRIRKIIRSAFEMLFLFGTYFRYTRAVIDGNMFGYDEELQFEDMQIEMPARYKCPSCGAEVPATSPGGMKCPGCGAFLGQESYYGAGEGNRKSVKQVGVKKIPRAGVKWSLHSPLEIDCDPKANGLRPLKMTAILCKDNEIDVGEGRRMFPGMYDKIQAGAESGTTPNASVEKLARIDAVSAMGGMTADNSLSNPTYSECWMQPMSFYKKGDEAFGKRMEASFPEGLKIIFIGQNAFDIRKANLEKEWSHCSLFAGQGIYCNALANTAVSFNARFNRVMWILDDWASRCPTGHNFADAARIDTEKMSGKQIPAGTMTPVPMRVNGEARPLSELLVHFDMPINPALWGYPQMLVTFCELILGIPRQLSGQGTQHDVETLGGQQLQLDRSGTVLKPYWEQVQDEHSDASQNAIECLQALMKTGAVTKIKEVIESQGGAWENNEVDWQSMQGNVQFSVDESQDLPIDPDELKKAIETMFEEMKAGNPAAVEWFDVPENQDLAQTLMLPGSIVPNEAQMLKTENDIQTILEKGVDIKQNPDGSIGSELPCHPGKWEDYPVAKKVLSRFLNKHFNIRIEQPDRWIALTQYWDELDEMDMQVAAKAANRQLQVKQAGSPPPPPPDQNQAAEMKQLLAVAGPAIQRLLQLAELDPMLTKGTANAQVSAAKEIVDTTIDAAKLAAGGK